MFSTLMSLPIAWAGGRVFSLSVSCLTRLSPRNQLFFRLSIQTTQGDSPEALSPASNTKCNNTYACKTRKISQKKTL